MSDADTIVAAATPPGRGGIGIVRLSGPAAQSIATGVLGTLPAARRAVFAAFRDAEQQTLDAGLALFFPGPHSYTGEDVVEFHGHGGPVMVESLIARLVELGARRANAGEFTQRAFLNDKLDLAQAEAVADLIDAGSREAARAAMRSLQGEFSTMIQVLTGAVIELRTYVEAAIDFPEEEVDFLADTALAERLANVAPALRRRDPQCRPGAPAARWHDRGAGRCAQCRQVQPPQSSRRLRCGHRHRRSRHHARCAARAHPCRWHAAAHPRYGRTARRAGCGGGRRHPARAGGNGARRSGAVRD